MRLNNVHIKPLESLSAPPTADPKHEEAESGKCNGYPGGWPEENGTTDRPDRGGQGTARSKPGSGDTVDSDGITGI